jgi:hypothetical protein
MDVSRASRLLVLTDGYSTEPLHDIAERLTQQHVPLDYRLLTPGVGCTMYASPILYCHLGCKRQWCKGGLKSLKMNEELRWCQNSYFNGDLLITSDGPQNYD